MQLLGHRPLVKYRNLSIASVVLLFIAFLLLLLVGLSLPIIKGIYLFGIKGTPKNQPPTSIATLLQFGVWGVCATSVFEQPEFAHECFGPQLGYTVPDSILSLTGVPPGVVNAVLKVLLVLLILHPISAGLALVALFFSLFLASHAITIVAVVFSFISAFLTSLVWAADLALVVVARNNIGTLSGFNLEVQFGNAIWMALVALLCTWTAMILLSARACYCCGVRKVDLEDDVETDL